MYFITPSDPNIFLIGVHENRIYGFGEEKNQKRIYGFGEEKNQKLCIYGKSIFDIGDWEELAVIDVNVVKAECCEGGIHVAAGVAFDKVWIAARENEVTRVFSVDIQTKEIDSFKMIEQGATPNSLNLCCKCLMPFIRSVGSCSNLLLFLIAPRRFNKDAELFQCTFIVYQPRYCTLFIRSSITLQHDPSSSIAFSDDHRILSVYERSEEDGTIRNVLVNHTNNNRAIVNLPGFEYVWDDMTFFLDNYSKAFALTRRRNADSVTLQLYIVDFSTDLSMKFLFIKSLTVDINFPAFELSPFILASTVTITDTLDENGMVQYCFSPNFIVFQTSAGIVTIPLRMLSLSESAYLSIRQIPEPPLPSSVDASQVKKLSIFQRIRKLFRRKPKKVTDPWMSLNFIKKTLGLPNNFDLN